MSASRWMLSAVLSLSVAAPALQVPASVTADIEAPEVQRRIRAFEAINSRDEFASRRAVLLLRRLWKPAPDAIIGSAHVSEEHMIAVVGSTGILGGEIVSRLRARGEAVRGLVRHTSDPARVQRLRAAGADIVQGDLKDPASLKALCQEASTVISTASIIVTAQQGDSFADTDSAGTCALIDAARAAGVQHFIFVSFDASNSNLTPDSPLTDAKRRVETHLKKSGMTWTILQPSLFMESWLGPRITVDVSAGTAKVLGDGERRIGYVSVFDVAEVAVQSVYRADARNATVRFGGPEAISQRDAIRIIEEEAGRKLERIEIPEQALAAQWSIAQDPFEKAFSGLMLGVARGFGDHPPPPDGFTDRMITVRDYARQVAQGVK